MNILDDISKADLSIRCMNTLRCGKIEKIIDLLKLTPEQLKSLRNIGSRTITEIKEFQDSVLTKDGVRFFISDDTPQDGDKVLTYEYGIWDYHKAPVPMPYWGNPNACVKLTETE
jgi:hypothetical protein